MNCVTNSNQHGIQLLNPSADFGPRAPGSGQGARNEFRAPVFRRAGRRGFTLMEVMIAVAILFTCLFAVLALVSNGLVTARKLQQHKAIDAGTVASVIYVALINTNRIDEGPIEIDWPNVLPRGYTGYAEINSIGTNGLGQVDFLIQHNQQLDLQSHFWIYVPSLKPGGISSSLPQH